MPLPPELSLTEEDWNRTPPAVQAVVLALWQQVQALQAQVAALQAEVTQLREQVGRNLIPVEQVQHVIDLKPTACDQCGALLLGEDAQPVRHQVTELPRVEPEVTEYRQHSLTCLGCGAQTAAEFPAEMPAGSFGPRGPARGGYLPG